ncbi:MAG: 30S ribosomal protein S6 [Candidatus Zixiibacteriota bacterium]|nr:MAG: 30S ribosomal protein S6 [candidate division Zixibacteria bacterium]
MRVYETTFILGPQADEATFDRQVKAISDLIHRYDGKVIKEQRTGIRRLAYPIRKFTQGYFTRMLFEGNKNVLTELERFYKLEEPYIRFLTVAFGGNVEDAMNDSVGRFRRKPARAEDRARQHSKKPDDSAKGEAVKPEAPAFDSAAEEVESTEGPVEEPSAEMPGTEPSGSEPEEPKGTEHSSP